MSARGADALRQALDALEALGVRTEVDGASATIKAALRRLDDGGAVVIVNPAAAIAEYDSVHPQRIACLALRSIDPPGRPKGMVEYLVVVKDREYDIGAAVRSWWTRPFKPPGDCVVCLREIGSGRATSYVRCNVCRAEACQRCFDRTSATDTAWRCPVCRAWQLSGSEYGTPWAALVGEVEPPPQRAKSAVDAFVDGVIGRLDGAMAVVPREGLAFDAKRSFEVNRLTCTVGRSDGGAKYGPDGVKLAAARKLLRRAVGEALARQARVRLYTLRQTYGIDAASGSPIVEVSAFFVPPPGDRLLQLHPDAWIDALPDDASAGFQRRKVAYLPPHDFAIARPEHVTETLGRLDAKLAAFPTATVWCEVLDPDGEPVPGAGFNYDTDASGAPATMHALTRDACLGMAVARAGPRDRVVLLAMAGRDPLPPAHFGVEIGADASRDLDEAEAEACADDLSRSCMFLPGVH